MAVLSIPYFRTGLTMTQSLCGQLATLAATQQDNQTSCTSDQDLLTTTLNSWKMFPLTAQYSDDDTTSLKRVLLVWPDEFGATCGQASWSKPKSGAHHVKTAQQKQNMSFKKADYIYGLLEFKVCLVHYIRIHALIAGWVHRKYWEKVVKHWLLPLITRQPIGNDGTHYWFALLKRLNEFSTTGHLEISMSELTHKCQGLHQTATFKTWDAQVAKRLRNWDNLPKDFIGNFAA